MRRWVLAAATATLALGAGCTGDEPAEPRGAGDGAPRSSPSRAEPPPTATAGCRLTPGGYGELAATPPGTASRVRLGPGREVEVTAATVAISRRGEPLQVAGVVYAQDCRTPLAGATVNAWQTDAAGRYGPGSACCYLMGVARTDGAGRYTFDTIFPGRYAGGDPPPRHIHLLVSHPRARSIMTELVFAGDPGVTPGDPLAVTPTRYGDTQRVAFDIVLRAR